MPCGNQTEDGRDHDSCNNRSTDTSTGENSMVAMAVAVAPHPYVRPIIDASSAMASTSATNTAAIVDSTNLKPSTVAESKLHDDICNSTTTTEHKQTLHCSSVTRPIYSRQVNLNANEHVESRAVSMANGASSCTILPVGTTSKVRHDHQHHVDTSETEQSQPQILPVSTNPRLSYDGESWNAFSKLPVVLLTGDRFCKSHEKRDEQQRNNKHISAAATTTAVDTSTTVNHQHPKGAGACLTSSSATDFISTYCTAAASTVQATAVNAASSTCPVVVESSNADESSTSRCQHQVQPINNSQRPLTTTDSVLAENTSSVSKRLCTNKLNKDKIEHQLSDAAPDDFKMSISNNGMANAEDSAVSAVSSNESAPKSPSIKAHRKRNLSSQCSSQACQSSSSGRWTQEEHQAFLEGLKECGREWKKVSVRIPSRTSAQIRSHAQKYFAKLQREQEHNHHFLTPSSLAENATTPHGESAAGVVAGVGGLLTGSSIATHPSATLAPSVQRNVERIMADPHAAQQEVEHTLEALRERYRQLQQRLENRRQRFQQQQHQRPPSSERRNGPPTSSSLAEAPVLFRNDLMSRKSILLDSHRPNQHHQAADENSSVSSNVSSIATNRCDLGSEEMIALQVLGDDLPRGDSSVEELVISDVAAVDLEESETDTNHQNLSHSMEIDNLPAAVQDTKMEDPIQGATNTHNRNNNDHQKRHQQD